MAYGNVANARILSVVPNPLMGSKIRYDVTIEADVIPPFGGTVVMTPKATLKKRDPAATSGETQLGSTQTMTFVSGTTYRTTIQHVAMSMSGVIIMAYVEASWQLFATDRERTAPWKLT